jgi:hypothetical protein
MPLSGPERRAREEIYGIDADGRRIAPYHSDTCLTCGIAFTDQEKAKRLDEYRIVEWAGVIAKQGATCERCDLKARVKALELDQESSRRAAEALARTCPVCHQYIRWIGTTCEGAFGSMWSCGCGFRHTVGLSDRDRF